MQPVPDDAVNGSPRPLPDAVKYYLASTRCTRCRRTLPAWWSERVVKAARSMEPDAILGNFPCTNPRCTDPSTGKRTIVYVVAAHFLSVTPIVGEAPPPLPRTG